MTEARCLLCYSKRFNKKNGRTYCFFCGFEAVEPWLSLDPELMKLKMEELHQEFPINDPQVTSSFKELTDYLTALRKEKMHQPPSEIQLKIKECPHCTSTCLKIYQDNVFCLFCANISSNTPATSICTRGQKNLISKMDSISIFE